jgi:cyclohexanecarboxylate-CoA ligase
VNPISEPATFAVALDAAASAHPDKPALVDGDRRLTYRGLHALVERTAGALAAAGAGPGDVITSRLANGVEAVVLCFAASRLGAVHNPVVTSHGDHELRTITKDAKSELLVDGPEHEIFHRPPRRSVPFPAADPAARRFLLYTSGSTARPKGVLHSDATLLAECTAQAAFHRLVGDEVFIVPSSVAHVSGLVYGVLLPVVLGATAVLMARWDPGEFLALVEAERATFCGGAPAFLQGAADHPDVARRDLSSLAVFPVGGADVPADLVRRATRRLGVRTGRGYGSTEFPSITSTAGPGTPDEVRATTDGRPIGANQVRIRDDEIEARGPELFCGYTDPTLDAEAFTTDGWFRTGDLGVIDADGYLTVTGRRKDIIIRLGEKISAREVEQLLGDHPAVHEVAVIAVPHPRTGERACACVVAADPNRPPTLAELAEFCEARGVSRRKIPEQLVVVDALPATPAGKTDKQALRARILPTPSR